MRAPVDTATFWMTCGQSVSDRLRVDPADRVLSARRGHGVDVRWLEGSARRAGTEASARSRSRSRSR